jgi:hypothetical protein
MTALKAVGIVGTEKTIASRFDPDLRLGWKTRFATTLVTICPINQELAEDVGK